MVAAYWLMFRSISVHIDPVVMLSQAVANVAGILVPFAPAGLGVREAAGAGYLMTQIPDAGAALVYASMARAWSFCVEVIVFLTGLLIRSRLYSKD
ncbi:amidohydrolase [Thiohalobacter thiocyanaticus]|uniref:Amidohydrolase n=2 Tax=Thiohalobacter thiocyanaticus TaxID=585455 RepID=A0A1Z4VTQ9_9GAMM|nr:amidohydrolase [Thiohalobacter thiocyanaticus]